MLDEETYKKELVRMWDMQRGYDYKGKDTCDGVFCEDCPLSEINNDERDGCMDVKNVFEIIKKVEKWSKEHPQKHKVSKLEYDILKIYIDLGCYGTFNGYAIPLSEILKKGYFAGATSKTNIRDYFNNCEAKEDV